MWLSKKGASREISAAEEGTLTVSSQGCTEATGTLQSRSAKAYSPFGYSYCAPAGEQVLIINGSSGAAYAGVEMEDGSLSPGEIKISSPTGSQIFLNGNGDIKMLSSCGSDIQLNGNGEINMSSPTGAYININGDGDIIMNGVTIMKNGIILNADGDVIF